MKKLNVYFLIIRLRRERVDSHRRYRDPGQGESPERTGGRKNIPESLPEQTMIFVLVGADVCGTLQPCLEWAVTAYLGGTAEACLSSQF